MSLPNAMGLFANLKKLISAFQGPQIDERVHLPEDELRRASVGNLYVYQQGGTLNTFTTGVDRDVLREVLASWWGITSREDAIDIIQYLATAPSQELCAYVFDAFEMDEAAARKHLVDNVPTADMLNKIFSYLGNLRSSFDSLVRNKVVASREELRTLGTLGWDAGRLNFIARAAMDYGYIKEDECREAVDYAYKMVAEQFDSWRELGRSYVLGRSIWSGDTSMVGLLDDLLQHPNSPWSYLSWR